MPSADLPTNTDVLVVGAGPAGSAAAYWLAKAGRDVVLADMATFPRDKTCGDGLTPRAVAELDHMGLGDWLSTKGTNRGLRAAGFNQEWYLEWPGGTLPNYGSAVSRMELDHKIRDHALAQGVIPVEGAKAVDAELNPDGSVKHVVFTMGDTTHTIACNQLVVADGVRSALGKVLGREWHRDTVYGVAGRSYLTSARSDDDWISSHLELRDDAGTLLAGYGWIFPLNNGEVNLGVGALSTAKRPSSIQIRPLMEFYAGQRREDWKLGEELKMPTSALLPMGGAVSNVAGKNWALIGDAAACVNPLNGEGIDYGLETGRFVAEILAPRTDISQTWPALLTKEYGYAFSIARRLAGLITIQKFFTTAGPIGMRSESLMRIALRLMGNLVTEDQDDTVAKLWRWAGRRSVALDERPPFS